MEIIFLSKEISFAQNSDAKMRAGYMGDYLPRAIAFSNFRCFKKVQSAQIENLSSIKMCCGMVTETERGVHSCRSPRPETMVYEADNR